jgi:hypothetical protein
MGSQLKKAHRTHALDQRAGTAYPAGATDPAAHETGGGDEAARLFRQLCQLVPDPGERAARLGIDPRLDESWRRGQMHPLLRAHRRALVAAIRAVANRG